MHSLPSRLSPALLASLVAALALACAEAPPAPPRDLNVVVLSIDTLRADRLGIYGNDQWGVSPSPRIDELAARGTVFDRAYVPRGQTHPSLASLLTGKYPITTGVRENGLPLGAEHLTLFEHLQAGGYQTGVFVANFQVDHPGDAWIARGAQVKGDGQRTGEEVKNESRWQVAWDDRVEASTLDYLDTVDRSRPFALWTHFYDVHKPYNPPEAQLGLYGVADDLPPVLTRPGPDSGQQLEGLLANVTLDRRELSDAELARIRGLYDGTLSSTDARIGRILDRLAELGELENTLIVFTSDHGEELFDHNRYFFHGGSIYDGVVRVPLVVAGPGVRAGARVDTHVQTIDLAPTVLTALELPVDAAMEGAPLTGLLDGSTSAPPAPFAFIEWQDLIYAVTDGRHKLIFNPDHVATRKSPWAFGKAFGVPPDAGFEIDCIEAYDLLEDPGEQHNLLAGLDLNDLRSGLPPHLAPMYEALGAWLAQPEHQGGMAPQGLDAEQMERMRQLGYIGTGSRADSVGLGACGDG